MPPSLLCGVCCLQLDSAGKLSLEDVASSIPTEWQKAELAVDGPTLTFVLADPAMQHKLAVLAAQCSGVVVSRSSPSQKAAIVKMMKEYEQWKASRNTRGIRRWYARYRRRLQVRGAWEPAGAPGSGWRASAPGAAGRHTM